MGEILALGLVLWLAIVVVRKFVRHSRKVARRVIEAKLDQPRRSIPPVVQPGWKPHWETTPAPQTAKRPSLEHGILKTAKAHNGIVTPADVSIGTGCGLDQAKLFLDRLVERGHAELRATRKGDLVYVFPSLLRRNMPEDLEPLT